VSDNVASWVFGGEGPARVHCVLVHGTWGAGTPFALEGSEFSEWVAEEAGEAVRFHRFEWSGKNSHRERVAAGERLGAFVGGLRAREARARVVVIGHSHGGNVGMYAMRGESGQADALVTIATPFLVVRPRRLPVHRLGWAWGVPACAAMALLGVAGWWVWGGWAWGLAMAAGLLLAVWAGVLLYKGLGAKGDVRDGVAASVRRWQAEAERELALPRETNGAVHAVVVRGDEALSVLRVFTALQQLPYYVWHGCVAVSRVGLWLLVLGGGAAALSVPMGDGVVHDALLWGGLGTVLVSVVCGVLVTLLPAVALVLPRVGFGDPGHFAELVMHVRASALPKGGGGGAVAAEHRVRVGAGIRLRHLNVCRRREVGRVVGGWVRGSLG